MKSKLARASIVAVTACALLTSNGIMMNNIPVVHAAATVNVSNKTVSLSATSTIALQDAQFLMQEQGRILAFTFTITNKGNRELPLADYWIRAKTTNGKSFSTKISDQDKNVKAIAPNSSRTLTYYTTVDKSTKLTDLIFDVIKWDFSVSNYESKLGSISIPKGTSELTPLYKEKAIKVGSLNVTSKISHYTLTSDTNNAYLQINYWLKNEGFNNVELNKLNYFIQTNSQAVYPISINAEEASVIRAGEQKLFTLNVTLPKNLIGSTLSLVTAIKDEAGGIMLPLAALKIPGTKDTTNTGIGNVKKTYMNGQPLNTFLDTAQVTKIMDKTNITLKWAIRNIGKESVEYPNFSFALMTKEGVSYPLNYKKSSDSVNKLLPQIREVVQIEGDLPLNIDLTSAKLVVNVSSAEGKPGYVMGAYQFKTTQQTGQIGSTYKYGNYEVKLNAVHRTASSDQDVLVADMQITNKGSDSVSVPLIGGYFMVNGVKLNSETLRYAMDNKVTLGANQSTNVMVYASIPYTADIKKLTFVVEDQSSGDAKQNKQIYQYTTEVLNEIRASNSETGYTVEKEGQRSSFTMKNSVLYSSEEADFYYVEFDANNLEARAALLGEVGGYLTNNNGEVIPVTFANTTSRIRSNGKVLLTGWAKLPRNFDKTSVQFIFGQKITPSEDENKTTNQVIIKPIKYNLDLNQQTQVKNTLENISFAGHQLSLKKVNAMLYVTGMYTVSGLKLSLDYTLIKDNTYDLVTGDHNLMIEFVDQSAGKVTYSKKLALNSTQTDNTVLKLGKDMPIELIFEDSEIQSKVQSYDNYVLNVYDVFQDAKILIASKELKWFQTE